MRHKPDRSGVSTGTVMTLIIVALVAIGCAFLFPKLLGMWSCASALSR